ncbi:cupin domain-containing protein [Geminocystis sp.]|uniref:cupin domain-containing protein n=1 Tax=Geminocystis sp. TaxID=2664100 RepID=UPI003593B59D
MNTRIFALENYTRSNNKNATVTEITQTKNSSVAVWCVKPGQIVQPHYHPDGQDTWVMIKGILTYYLGDGQSQSLNVGDIALADKNQIHGAINESNEDAIFISIYSAPNIGYEKASP